MREEKKKINAFLKQQFCVGGSKIYYSTAVLHCYECVYTVKKKNKKPKTFASDAFFSVGIDTPFRDNAHAQNCKKKMYWNDYKTVYDNTGDLHAFDKYHTI